MKTENRYRIAIQKWKGDEKPGEFSNITLYLKKNITAKQLKDLINEKLFEYRVIDNQQPNFLDDEEKMLDFKELTKQEFLALYSYVSEQEYDETMKIHKEEHI